MKILILALIILNFVRCSSSDTQLKANKIIQLKCTIGYDTLDTFNNTFTRNDVYGKAFYTIDFSFTLDEQERIISEINKVNFFGLPDSLAHDIYQYDENTGEKIINFIISGEAKDQFIDVLMNEKRKKIFWVDYSSYKNNDEYLRLNSVMKIIREIVRNRKGVQGLPGGVWY
jgi:hypothetical protein